MWVDARILNGIASRHPNPVEMDEVAFLDCLGTKTSEATPRKSPDAGAAAGAEVASPDTVSKLAAMLTGHSEVSEFDGAKRTFYEINPLKNSICRPFDFLENALPQLPSEMQAPVPFEASSNAKLTGQIAYLREDGKIHAAYELAPLPESACKKIWELPEEEYQQQIASIKKSIAGLESIYTEQEAPDYPPQLTQTYASVTLHGRVVAEIDNQGCVKDWGDLGKKFLSYLPDSAKTGPDLAKARAKFIATAMGGAVHMSSTALTQKQFDHLPAIEEPKPRIDYEALKQDEWYTLQIRQLADLKQKRLEFLAAQTSAPG